METISIHLAKAKLSGLVEAVEKKGARIVLSRYGKPVAEITPYRARQRSKKHPQLSQMSYRGDLTAPTDGEWSDV